MRELKNELSPEQRGELLRTVKDVDSALCPGPPGPGNRIPETASTGEQASEGGVHPPDLRPAFLQHVDRGTT
jgi:hypothetical protein